MTPRHGHSKRMAPAASRTPHATPHAQSPYRPASEYLRDGDPALLAPRLRWFWGLTVKPPPRPPAAAPSPFPGRPVPLPARGGFVVARGGLSLSPGFEQRPRRWSELASLQPPDGLDVACWTTGPRGAAGGTAESKTDDRIAVLEAAYDRAKRLLQSVAVLSAL